MDGSDERGKEDIVDTTVDGLATINAISVKDFTRKKSGDRVTAGFTAQQLQTAYPEAVSQQDAVPAVLYEEGEDAQYYTSYDETQYYVDGDDLPDGKQVGDIKTESQIPEGKVVGDVKSEGQIPEGKSVGDVKTEGYTPYMGVSKDSLIGPLVKAVQQLSAKVTALESA